MSRRMGRYPTLGVREEEHLLLHPGYRLALVLREGVIQHYGIVSRLFPRRVTSTRSFVLVPLAGTLYVTTDTKQLTLRPGDVMTACRNLWMDLRTEPSPAMLWLEWEGGGYGDGVRDPFSTARLSPGAFAGVLDAVQRIRANRHDRENARLVAGEALAELFAILRATGAPLERVEAGDLVEEVDPRIEKLSRGLDRILSQPSGERPMLVDLECSMGMSKRQIQRYTSEFLRHYRFNATAGLRDIVRRWSVDTGIALMSAPQATTEEVARIVGYASPNAFCKAFADIGLPSPGVIRQQLLKG